MSRVASLTNFCVRVRGVGRKAERWGQTIKKGLFKIGGDKQHDPLINVACHRLQAVFKEGRLWSMMLNCCTRM